MFVPILLSIFVCPQEDVGQRTDVLFIGDRGHHQPFERLKDVWGALAREGISVFEKYLFAVDEKGGKVVVFDLRSGSHLGSIGRRAYYYCFTDDGEYQNDHIYRKEPSTKNCRWCEFKDKPELCDRDGVKV